MYLSKIDIVGFKSFANKIHVKFDTGMTAIVGPNGCGKTNVVDAIRWALGEQKPSMLRSDKMEDVIFNGTKARKPLGMAEVALTIENTKGVLPIEFSEVTVTRRVYRSGDSEYYLNGTLCRLKDIRDLFMDTGMGSDAYSVIELKMVETILSDNADERRHMFEEAAGIVKYKHRRKETLRRLSNVQQDLTRVNDIFGEVEKAVNSLDRQAKKAEQFNSLTNELKDLEINLLEREFTQISLEVEPLENNLVEFKSEKEKITTELNKGESELDELKSGLEVLEQALHTMQSEISGIQEKINDSKQIKVSSTERRIYLIDAIKKYEKENVQLLKQKEEFENKIQDINLKYTIVFEEFEKVKAIFEQKNDDLNKEIINQETKKEESKYLQDKVIKLLHNLNEIRNEVERNKARVENIHGRVESSVEENNRFVIEISQSEAEANELNHRHKNLKHEYAEKEISLSEIEVLKNSLQKEIDSFKLEEFEVKTLRERKKNRRDFLQSLIESHDGISVGAKYLITESDIKNNIFNTIGEIIDAEENLSNAIEVILNETAGYLIVENISEAHRGIEILKKTNKGKATFICLNRIPKIENVNEKINAEKIEKYLRYDSKYENLIKYIFNKIYLVDSLVDAVAITNENKNISCVTKSGEIVSYNGIVRGGQGVESEANLLNKNNQIEILDKEISQLANDIDEINSKKLEIENKLSQIKLTNLKVESKTIEQKMTGIEMRIAQIEYEKKRMVEQSKRNSQENVKLTAELSLLENKIGELTPQISNIEDEKSQTEQNSGAVKNELDRIEQIVSEMTKDVNESKVALVQKENLKNNLQREIEFINSSIASIDENVQNRKIDIEKSHFEINELEKKLGIVNEQLEMFSSEFKNKDEERKVFDKDVTHKRKSAHSIELKIKDERRLHDSSIGKLHEIELRLSKLKTRKESIVSIAKEEFNLELIVKEFPSEPVFNLETAKEDLHSKKEKLKTLGAVNFAAFDEHKSEKERLDFMTTQRNDLIEAEKTLLSTIDEINNTAQKKFLDTYSIIRENFISIFKELFDEGDECDLILEEGEDIDPLEAHIQIIAKPRGKRPSSIDLLSGGEKTLTAIALLFAIYLVKPSPFCILDEVDAPLDDSNIDRYSRMIRKFSTNTQFIIVTHNKRTMEATNAMYGVTMEEEGVSKLVSVRFNEPVSVKQ